MLKVSKLADYGTLMLVYMARTQQQFFNARDIAVHTHIALPTVSKLLKLLTRAGLLQSQRGAKGGYCLARNPDAITVADIIQALDGNFAMTECSFKSGICAIESFCDVATNWQLINRAIYHALDCLTLEDMTKPMKRDHVKASHDMISNLSHQDGSKE